MDNIKDFISKNKSLFETINGSYAEKGVGDPYTKYSILDYTKIMESIIDYVDGYLEYKSEDNDQYRGKINASTTAFYNKMFTDPSFRTTITLADFRSVNKRFLEQTKVLQDKIQMLENCVDGESRGLAIITDRQYKKLGKVMKDDMNIYMWKTFGKEIDAQIKVSFDDRTTPVMHRERG